MLLTTIFCETDDFCKNFQKQFKVNLLSNGDSRRNRSFSMTLSEIMAIIIFFPYSGYKTFKDYYEKHVMVNMKADFPGLVSYTRFLELKQKCFFALLIFATSRCGKCTGISFIDSFSLEVCHIKREHSNKVFQNFAKKGMTSMGWFFGFKLHLMINHLGEIIGFFITPGNVADNNENVLMKLTKKVFGKLFGDKGYLINSELFEKLYNNGVQLITKLRKNMKNKLMLMKDKILLGMRRLIETVGGLLKEQLSLEHTRHRSKIGFFVHIFSVILAYSFREHKPSIGAKPIALPKFC